MSSHPTSIQGAGLLRLSFLLAALALGCGDSRTPRFVASDLPFVHDTTINGRDLAPLDASSTDTADLAMPSDLPDGTQPDLSDATQSELPDASWRDLPDASSSDLPDSVPSDLPDAGDGDTPDVRPADALDPGPGPDALIDVHADTLADLADLLSDALDAPDPLEDVPYPDALSEILPDGTIDVPPCFVAADCDDGDPCTDDLCVPGAGCIYRYNSDPCDDGDACTTASACSSGVCLGMGLLSCDDGLPCTKDRCDTRDGCLHDEMAGTCDDGDPCTTNDRCVDGACLPGTPLACDDGTPCTNDRCTPGLGCTYTHAESLCDDHDLCSLGDHCAAGACVPESYVDCDDGNPCTDDSCNPSLGCVHTDNIGPCEDGNLCTLDDRCQDGECHVGVARTCNDHNPCTIDSCRPDRGCLQDSANDGLPCDDGSECTSDDACSGGVCRGIGRQCDDGNPCTDDLCNLQSGCTHVPNSDPCTNGDPCYSGDTCVAGMCVRGAPVECDDANPCTEDRCDPETGCGHAHIEGGCDDGNPCTTGDRCNAGRCAPTGVNACDDSNACTVDSCAAGSGCVHAARSGACSDGNVCTTVDVCTAGTCVGTLLRDCGDGNGCTDDRCDPASGCVHVPNRAACDDGLTCTVNDACAAGICAGGAARDCSDGNACTTDQCSEPSGCVHRVGLEVCNGSDDDCDGLTDEDLGTTTCGAGECRLTSPNCLDGATHACTPRPPAGEVCDGKDNDCNGRLDDLPDVTCGLGDCRITVAACAGGAPNACVPKAPGLETCDTRDNDCDGVIDEEGASGCIYYYSDGDGDGFGNTALRKCLCGAAVPYTATVGGDCADGNSSIHPDATEICNALDDDCDTLTDPEATPGCIPYYADADQDGFGAPASALCLCSWIPSNPVRQGGDCNDASAAINPMAIETCNGIDDDCNLLVDDPGAKSCTTYYVDRDEDGFGTTDSQCLCAPTGQYTAVTGGDCRDSNPGVNPGVRETCNGIDDDCNTILDDGATCPPGPTGPGQCVAGACTYGCAAGWFDVDGDAANGCECQQDSNDGSANECETAVAAGTLVDNLNGSVTVSGRVVPGDDEDWYEFTATDTADTGTLAVPGLDRFHVRVRLASPTDGSIAFQVIRGACGAEPACLGTMTAYDWANEIAADPTRCVTATSWNCCAGTNCDTGGTPSTCCEGTTLCADPAIGMHYCADDSATFRVRVYRAFGSPTKCADTDYRLVLSNGDGERCNGLDDDADGHTDEGCDGDNDGYCESTKVVTPGAACVVGDCDDSRSAINPAATERCDGIDNDCDGTTDEVFPVGQACDGADGDNCKKGTWTCKADGSAAECVNESASYTEKCNGVDDDCDSSIDEGFPLGQTCDGADADSCKKGTWTCKADGSAAECVNETASYSETCNGNDDDCDGSTDETFPESGHKCDSNPNSAIPCEVGHKTCSAGKIVCTGDVECGAGSTCSHTTTTTPEVCTCGTATCYDPKKCNANGCQ